MLRSNGKCARRVFLWTAFVLGMMLPSGVAFAQG